jgi:hypothetical protein
LPAGTRADLLVDRLTTYRCPRCPAVTPVENPRLYHNPGAGLLIQVLGTTARLPPPGQLRIFERRPYRFRNSGSNHR